MSAATKDAGTALAEAQGRLRDNQAQLADLEQRLQDGDTSVTGTLLVAAEGQVRADVLTVEAARRVADAEAATNAAAQRAAAVDAAVTSYEATGAELRGAASAAVQALSGLIVAAATHVDSTVAATAGLRDRHGRLEGHGKLVTPDPVEIVQAVVVKALQDAGLPTGHLFPHTVLGPLAPYL